MKNLRITVNGTTYDVQVEELGESAAPAAAVPAAAPAAPAAAAPKKAAAPAAAGAGQKVAAPMPGTIVSVNVSNGQSVKKGDVLVVLEAMKMENEILAEFDGTVTEIFIKKGDSVLEGANVVTLA